MGLWVFWSTPSVVETPVPRLAQTASEPVASARQVISVQTLSRPWAAPPRVVPLAPVPPPRPVPVVAAPDAVSLRFLGVLTGESDVRTFLFKFLPNGKILTLVVGQEAQGWTLVEITDHQYSLKGPGGNYVVAR